jgi:DNA-binding NarL/FixJ family response regulator
MENVLNKLSEREKEVAESLVNEITNQKMAQRLFISVSTIKAHLHSIYQKLNITGQHARTELTILILRSKS